jgi:hypothetical protein
MALALPKRPVSRGMAFRACVAGRSNEYLGVAIEADNVATKIFAVVDAIGYAPRRGPDWACYRSGRHRPLRTTLTQSPATLTAIRVPVGVDHHATKGRVGRRRIEFAVSQRRMGMAYDISIRRIGSFRALKRYLFSKHSCLQSFTV